MLAVSQDDRGAERPSSRAVVDGRAWMNFWRQRSSDARMQDERARIRAL